MTSQHILFPSFTYCILVPISTPTSIKCLQNPRPQKEPLQHTHTHTGVFGTSVEKQSYEAGSCELYYYLQ